MLGQPFERLAETPRILEALHEAVRNFVASASNDAAVLRRYRDAPAKTFLEYGPPELRDAFDEDHIEEANTLMLSPGRTVELPLEILQGSSSNLDKGQLKCFACRAALATVLALASGGSLLVAQGALVAPLTVVEPGLVPLLASVTGVEPEVVSDKAEKSGFTFGMLLLDLCGKMRAC